LRTRSKKAGFPTQATVFGFCIEGFACPGGNELPGFFGFFKFAAGALTQVEAGAGGTEKPAVSLKKNRLIFLEGLQVPRLLRDGGRTKPPGLAVSFGAVKGAAGRR